MNFIDVIKEFKETKNIYNIYTTNKLQKQNIGVCLSDTLYIAFCFIKNKEINNTIQLTYEEYLDYWFEVVL